MLSINLYGTTTTRKAIRKLPGGGGSLALYPYGSVDIGKYARRVKAGSVKTGAVLKFFHGLTRGPRKAEFRPYLKKLVGAFGGARGEFTGGRVPEGLK